MSTTNPFYSGEKARALINLPGLVQLAYDLQQKLASEGAYLFVVNSPEDLRVLIKLMPASECYGVLLQGLEGPHKTPILIHEHHYYILDSLGQAPSSPIIERSINDCYEGRQRPEVLFSNHMRQSDGFSCGTDGLTVIEGAIRIGAKLIEERLSKGADYLNPTFVKYTQGVSRVKPTTKKGVSPQTYSLLYPEELKSYFFDAITQRWNSLETYINQHITINGKYNLAIDKKVLEHAERLDEIMFFPKEALVTRARAVLPLNMLRNASFKTLSGLFRKSENSLDWLNESLGLIKTDKDFKVVCYNFLNDPEFLTQQQNKLEQKIFELEDNYIEGSQDVSLIEIGKLLFSMRYIEKKHNKIYCNDLPRPKTQFFTENDHLTWQNSLQIRSAPTSPVKLMTKKHSKNSLTSKGDKIQSNVSERLDMECSAVCRKLF